MENVSAVVVRHFTIVFATMPTLPEEDAPLVRSSFTSDATWTKLCTTVTTPNDQDFRAYVSLVDDKAWEGVTPIGLANAARKDKVNALVAFIADEQALEGEMPVLVVELDAERAENDEPRTFRCVATELWSVENNLDVGNMGWEDFTYDLRDGVHRGFSSEGLQLGAEAPPMQLDGLNTDEASRMTLPTLERPQE